MYQVTEVKVFVSLAKSALAGVFGLFLVNSAWSDYFDNFRYVGTSITAGDTVTSIELTDNAAESGGELAFFNAAGLSTVYKLNLRPSTVITAGTDVHHLASDAGDFAGLGDILFYTAELKHDSADAPPHWFRLTHYQGQWSGAFRVADKIYAISHRDPGNVVDVRSTSSTASQFRAQKKVTISAVVDPALLHSEPDLNQISALESVHVMDGLLSDSLGLTVSLEQLVLSSVYSPGQTTQTIQDSTFEWLQKHTDTLGLDDNLATLFFVDGTVARSHELLDGSLGSSAVVIPDPGQDYHFATAHQFGKLLRLREQPGTLQDWQENGLVSLPAVHWSQQQLGDFEANPLPAELVQTLNNDEPDNSPPTPTAANEIDPLLVESDSPETQSPNQIQDDPTAGDPTQDDPTQGNQIQNDTDIGLPLNNLASSATTSGGGGSTTWWALLWLLAVACWQHPRRSRSQSRSRYRKI